MQQKLLPLPLVGIHGGMAVIAFVVLLFGVLSAEHVRESAVVLSKDMAEDKIALIRIGDTLQKLQAFGPSRPRTRAA